MTPQEKNRLIELINNPPPGSKLAEAKEYGIDLTLLLENLTLTVSERLRKGSEAAFSAKQIRRAFEQSRGG